MFISSFSLEDMLDADPHSDSGSLDSSPPPAQAGPSITPDGRGSEADLLATLKDKLTTGQQTETRWISPTADHSELLVQILQYIYPQHATDKTFQWCYNKVGQSKYI